jgi:5'-nucleotidase
VRVVVTNDDGVDAPGLHALARAVADDGHDVVVAAPVHDLSGSGAAIGRLHADDYVDVQRVSPPGLDDLACWAVDGPPALAVMAARLGGFGEPPDVVVSGINPGANTGRSILHSGTVGAALTAANFGCSGLAVSMAGQAPWAWETAAELAVVAVRWLADAPRKTVLNLNVPNLPVERLLGVRWARLATFGTVRAAMVESADGRLQMELRDTAEPLPPDVDTALVAAGWAAVTSITGIRAADHVPIADVLEAHLPRRTA